MPELSAMLLAAGRGERLRPLTDHRPKPLIEVAGRPLIEHALDRLAAAGVTRCVINLSWLGEQIREHLGRHWRWDMTCAFSDESSGRLETGGGIYRALPLLGEEPFLLVNGDVWSDCPLAPLAELARDWPVGRLGHLVLVDNPSHNPAGDFSLHPDGQLGRDGPRLTYSGLAALHPEMFSDCQPGAFPLLPRLLQAISAQALTGEHYRGHWTDVGTPQRLAQLRRQLGDPAEAAG